MIFKVIERRAPFPPGHTPIFVLRQDGWDDFGFKTLYSLYYVEREEGKYHDDVKLIGNVKILMSGQAISGSSILTEDFESLDDAFCSVGQSLDYYERLAELGPERRDAVLEGLRDLVRFPELGMKFEGQEGWRSSLFRDFSPQDEFIVLARSLLTGDYTNVPAKDLKFSFQVAGWENAVDFDFTVPVVPRSTELFRPNPLPARVAVIIGRNGSGKSTLLARLARVAHGTASGRLQEPLRSLGTISPAGIGFPRIVTVSYSAFDSFKIPGVTRSEQEQIVKDVEQGEGRFIFCGLRDIAEEVKHEMEGAQGDPLGDQRVVDQDRLHRTLLKPIEKLADEFERTLHQISKKGREEIFDVALEKLLSDASFSGSSDLCLDSLMKDGAKKRFLSWSTGHKIVMQIVSSVAAHAEPRSLVLIDEPETHLHPPLLATLMHAVRLILRHFKAFAIIATHSPVVLQETMSKHVRVVTREGSVTDTRLPSIETFGESIGLVTAEVFRLNSEITDFYTILDKLVESMDSTETIESLFLEGGMSLQARSYVMSAFARTKG